MRLDAYLQSTTWIIYIFLIPFSLISTTLNSMILKPLTYNHVFKEGESINLGTIHWQLGLLKAYEEPIMPMTTNLTASKICFNKFFRVHH